MHDLTYTEVTNRSVALNGTVFAFVTDANSLYNLPPARHETITCSPHIIKVTYNRDRTFDLQTDFERPQVLISGEVHGDERVGPQASLILAELLVHSARCEVCEIVSSLDEMRMISDFL